MSFGTRAIKVCSMQQVMLYCKFLGNLNAHDDSGEVLQLSHVVGDKTSELELKEMVVRVTIRNSAKLAVCMRCSVLLTCTLTCTHEI